MPKVFTKDGQVRKIDSPAEAVALRYDGWVEVDAAPEPEPEPSTPEQPSKPTRKS